MVMNKKRITMPLVLFKLFFCTISLHVLLVWLVLVLLVSSLDLIRLAGGRAFFEAFLLAILKIPYYALEILPFACIIGATLAVQRMAANNSLVALRTTGLSPLQIVAFSSATAIVFSFAYLLVSETLLAPSEELARYIKKDTRHTQNVWLRNDDDFIRIQQVRPDGVLVSLVIYQMNELKLNNIITAERAQLLQPLDNAADNNSNTQQWQLDNVINNGRAIETFPYTLPLSLETLDSFKKSPRYLSLSNAITTHNQLSRAGQRNADLLLIIWQHTLLPPSLILLTAASIWFIGRQRRSGGTSFPVLLAALIGGVYYIGLKIAVQLSISQDLALLLILPLLLLAAFIYKGIQFSRHH